MIDWYKLDENRNPVKCCSHQERSDWLASVPEKQRTGLGCIVAKWEADGVSVSTAFISLDHGLGGSVPIVFETIIFGGERDQEVKRYATWSEAEKGHARIVESLTSPRHEPPSFSQMINRVEELRRGQLASMQRIAESEPAFAIALEVQDRCWDALTYLCNFESVKLNNGEVHSSDDLVEMIKDAMANSFEGITGRPYIPEVCSGRYESIGVSDK